MHRQDDFFYARIDQAPGARWCTTKMTTRFLVRTYAVDPCASSSRLHLGHSLRPCVHQAFSCKPVPRFLPFMHNDTSHARDFGAVYCIDALRSVYRQLRMNICALLSMTDPVFQLFVAAIFSARNSFQSLKRLITPEAKRTKGPLRLIVGSSCMTCSPTTREGFSRSPVARRWFLDFD